LISFCFLSGTATVITKTLSIGTNTDGNPEDPTLASLALPGSPGILVPIGAGANDADPTNASRGSTPRSLGMYYMHSDSSTVL
jgi:hypothetical protein